MKQKNAMRPTYFTQDPESGLFGVAFHPIPWNAGNGCEKKHAQMQPDKNCGKKDSGERIAKHKISQEKREGEGKGEYHTSRGVCAGQCRSPDQAGGDGGHAAVTEAVLGAAVLASLGGG